MQHAIDPSCAGYLVLWCQHSEHRSNLQVARRGSNAGGPLQGSPRWWRLESAVGTYYSPRRSSVTTPLVGVADCSGVLRLANGAALLLYGCRSQSLPTEMLLSTGWDPQARTVDLDDSLAGSHANSHRFVALGLDAFYRLLWMTNMPLLARGAATPEVTSLENSY